MAFWHVKIVPTTNCRQTVPSKLARLGGVQHLRKFGKYLRRVEKDLRKIGCREFEVSFELHGKQSFLRHFISVSSLGTAEQTMLVAGIAFGCAFRVGIPMSRRVMLPYWIEIIMSHSIDGTARFLPGTFRGKWVCEPANAERSVELAGLGLPSPNPHHRADGVGFHFAAGHVIEPEVVAIPWGAWPSDSFDVQGDESNPYRSPRVIEESDSNGFVETGKTRWTVVSGYEGLFRPRPSVAEYLRKIPTVDRWLRQLAERQ